MIDIREHARKYAEAVQAKERVNLRRWLRKYAPKDAEGNLPDHLYLSFNRDELVELVEQYGGDSQVIIEQAKNATIDRIMERKGR